MNRTFRAAAVAGVWSTALAVALGTAMTVVAAEGTNDGRESVLAEASPVRTDIVWESLRRGEEAKVQMAQFQLPKAGSGEEGPIKHLPRRLTYQYSFGSESEILYRNDPDLNAGVQDNYLFVIPELNGTVVYRPTDWMDTTLEMILERVFPVQEESTVILPNGETQAASDQHLSLLVDQAFVTIKGFTAPFKFHVGRRNYEDERHWLYDTSMDVASVSLRKGHVRAEASVGRAVLLDLDLLISEEKDRINTYILYAEYRGIENLKFDAYTVYRDDRSREEGRPLLMGVSGQGSPSGDFSYWTRFSYLLGSDEANKNFSAYAVEVGGTYRFPGLPYHPNVTLGYAFATGDGNHNDNRNTEFRQTGLQSNEAKFAGVSDLLVYGETLDPELSNLGIFTAGFGFRPTPTVTVDFIYHHYRLDEIAEEIRNSPITALMNQDDTKLSKEVGQAFDIVLGVRNLFGVRRLGVDLRMGWFFPGNAFRIEGGDPDNPIFRPADIGSSIVAKFWY